MHDNHRQSLIGSHCTSQFVTIDLANCAQSDSVNVHLISTNWHHYYQWHDRPFTAQRHPGLSPSPLLLYDRVAQHSYWLSCINPLTPTVAIRDGYYSYKASCARQG